MCWLCVDSFSSRSTLGSLLVRYSKVWRCIDLLQVLYGADGQVEGIATKDAGIGKDGKVDMHKIH